MDHQVCLCKLPVTPANRSTSGHTDNILCAAIYIKLYILVIRSFFKYVIPVFCRELITFCCFRLCYMIHRIPFQVHKRQFSVHPCSPCFIITGVRSVYSVSISVHICFQPEPGAGQRKLAAVPVIIRTCLQYLEYRLFGRLHIGIHVKVTCIAPV